MFFWNLLDGAEGTDPETSPATGGLPGWVFPVVIGVLVVLLLLWFFYSSRKNKQRNSEYAEQLNAIQPGNKVKSAGGLCGVVVEVCDDNTVIIETGSDKSGKSYFKLDKASIYQTDAKGPAQIAREAKEAEKKAGKEGKASAQDEAPMPAEEPAKEPVTPEEAPSEQETLKPAEEPSEAETTQEETPAEE